MHRPVQFPSLSPVSHQVGHSKLVECDPGSDATRLQDLSSSQTQTEFKRCVKCGEIKTIYGCTRCRNTARREKNRIDPQPRRTQRRNWQWNMSEAEFQAKLNGQGDVCAICGRTNPDRTLAVDHDHRCCPVSKSNPRSCGKCNRGLLCTPCNQALGKFGDSIDTLLAAVSYLRKWESIDAGH